MADTVSGSTVAVVYLAADRQKYEPVFDGHSRHNYKDYTLLVTCINPCVTRTMNTCTSVSHKVF